MSSSTTMTTPSGPVLPAAGCVAGVGTWLASGVSSVHPWLGTAREDTATNTLRAVLNFIGPGRGTRMWTRPGHPVVVVWKFLWKQVVESQNETSASFDGHGLPRVPPACSCAAPEASTLGSIEGDADAFGEVGEAESEVQGEVLGHRPTNLLHSWSQGARVTERGRASRFRSVAQRYLALPPSVVAAPRSSGRAALSRRGVDRVEVGSVLAPEDLASLRRCRQARRTPAHGPGRAPSDVGCEVVLG